MITLGTIGLIASGVGLAANALSTWANDKKKDLTIREEVRKALSEERKERRRQKGR